MEHFFVLLVGSKRLKRLIQITLLLKLKVSFWGNFWGNHTKYLPTETKWFSQAHQRATFQSSLLLVFPKSFVESYVMLLLKEKYKISLGVQYCSKTPLHKVIFRKAWKDSAGIYLFDVNNGNTRTMCEICWKLSIKALERRQWLQTDFAHCSRVSTVNVELVNARWKVLLLR